MGEDGRAEGRGTSKAFLKVLRTVGEAVGSVAQGRERAVFDFPQVLGTEAVWRVSFGREDRALPVVDERPQDIFWGGWTWHGEGCEVRVVVMAVVIACMYTFGEF